MSVNSELYWFLVGADTATSGSGKSEATGQKIFDAGRRRWCHHLARCPSCLFSAFANQEVDFKYPLLSQILYPKLSKLFHESDELFSLIFAVFFPLRLF